MNRYQQYLMRFKDLRILVVGDLMLDKFVWGDVSRISPEAPVQIVKVRKETYAPGGAANVAANIGAFSRSTAVMGILGKDDSRNLLITLLEKRGVSTKAIIIDKEKPTVQKMRILCQNQQLLRIDYEKPEYLSKKDERMMVSTLSRMIRQLDAIVISDYAKGVITGSFMQHLIKEANRQDIPVIVDPKPKHVAFYKGATLITPNHKEACLMAGFEEDNSHTLLAVGKRLLEETGANILVTRGEKGMSLFKQDDQVIHIPTKAKEVYDVTGAGDTVIATLALSLAAKASLEEAAEIANHAAGIVVGKVGTATLTIDELRRSLQDA